MKMSVQALGFDLTPGLLAHLERRLHFALGRTDAQVFKLWVRLSDLNGPRGGRDKCCHLRIALTDAPAMVVEDIEADLYVAIDRAADRAGRTVARRLERLRDLPPLPASLARIRRNVRPAHPLISASQP